ncbi:transmembrane protein 164 [Parasteatoda tepidariorum]|uniref:transmembrane protein 164 n=1 Tax=Parasteatoda tepidariorum TaxID=114398 RepID=UPI00077FA1CA|nr:transmembrane protein 164 [Parasteatoda tepidariorum]XP_015912609.1 transmembrane protein 164 [Parasteatoda tepidariorum]XP_015912610.1 transmembrane protein 164 [Parasteatoda tepidariorum]XP_015912611.1 transmembrane protein 164 [Parasteatoda tepidariorum]XP_015912612.1 transmembrane protein 164 [Parasteatoda tepidariorum]XP_042908296.1 transmembrane protein 164 [Parasteatoda tepidariorum]
MSWKLADVGYWSYQGVNHSIQGNGGPECTNFLSLYRRVWETLIACAIGFFGLYYGLKRCTLPPVPKVFREDRGGKRLLLVLMCLVFGIEIGFKFSSRTMIYILNPCHVITTIQIFLLAAPPTSKTVTFLFRIQNHCLYGAVLAILFPVLNTRKRPLELEIYWIQHFLILITPFYLLRTGISGVYSLEPLADMSWAALTLGLVFLYHFLPLQILGMLTEVNLNNMVCPAVSDPFYGPNYRIYALFHQAALILLIGKIYSKISLLLLEAMGTLVWTGDKLITTATSKEKQICVTCKAQLIHEGSQSTSKSHIN